MDSVNAILSAAKKRLHEIEEEAAKLRAIISAIESPPSYVPVYPIPYPVPIYPSYPIYPIYPPYEPIIITTSNNSNLI